MTTSTNPVATKPVRIDGDLYNGLIDFLDNVKSERPVEQTRLLNDLRAILTIYDDCIDGDGSGLCETHNYRPMAYYVDITGKLLKRGSFDPEETGFPVCEDSQRYDSKMEARYNR